MQELIFSGAMTLSGTVDVTDPCLEQADRCRLTLTGLRHGVYCCYLQRVPMEYVQGLFLVHEDYPFSGIQNPEADSTWKLVGRIGVDAGMAGFFDRKPDWLRLRWGELMDWIEEQDTLAGGRLHAYRKQFDGRDGFWSTSGYGDGDYRVFVQKNGGETIAACLWFEDEE